MITHSRIPLCLPLLRMPPLSSSSPKNLTQPSTTTTTTTTTTATANEFVSGTEYSPIVQGSTSVTFTSPRPQHTTGTGTGDLGRFPDSQYGCLTLSSVFGGSRRRNFSFMRGQLLRSGDLLHGVQRMRQVRQQCRYSHRLRPDTPRQLHIIVDNAHAMGHQETTKPDL